MREWWIMNKAQYAAEYASLGWHLVPIPAGKKGPVGLWWNTPARCISDPARAAEHWTANPSQNMGLLHGASNTCVLDIDHVENTRLIFEELGIDYEAILASGPRIVGRLDRGKVLFRAPAGVMLATHKLAWPRRDEPAKTEAIFELRAGPVQDVLPPSIHPDTGRAYEWAGPDFRDGLPDIPPQLLVLWREWDKFRPQMADMCPWKARREVAPRPKKTRPVSDRTSAIDAFNATNDMHETLVRYGYKPTRRGRYLSPNSGSGIAGVVLFEDGHAYSHHASDPFDSAHTFDAFDLFCHYEHGGDASAAVKALTRTNHYASVPEPEHAYDPEAIEHGRQVFELWRRQEQPTEASPLDGIPAHLLTVPGVLGDVVNYYNETASRMQPQFAVQAALGLGSVVLGRRWVTDQKNMSAIYLVNVARSATGKEHAKTVIERTLEAAGLSGLLGPSGYTSATGVFSALIDRPNHISIIDELGRMLASSQATGNHHKVDAQTIIMEVFGRQTSTLRPQGFSKMGLNKQQSAQLDKVVTHPSLTILGMTTPDTLYGSLTTRFVKDGFLNRFVIVESYIGRQVGRYIEHVDVPQSVIEWASAHAVANGGGMGIETHDVPPLPVEVPFAPECRAMLRQCDQHMIELMDEHDKFGLGEMFGRTKEIAQRIALIVARSCGEDQISTASLQWAIDYATFYALRTVAALRRAMSDGPFEAVCKAVHEKLQEAGLRGMTEREISREVSQYRGLEPRKRIEVMQALVNDYGVTRSTGEKGIGRPRNAWVVGSEEG